ncbi:MAG: glycosyltransferase [Sulfitobacter sp.]
MRGDGTKAAITTNSMVAARVIDLTRSLRRAGRVPTGIDRVERAYLAHLLTENVPLFGLVRTPLGYLLLDQNGLVQFQRQLDGDAAWGRASGLTRLARRHRAIVQRAVSDLRRSAVARVRRGRLQTALGNALPDGFEYFNVGHSNLTDRVLHAVQAAGGHIQVLIHDVIPLTHPQFQRSGTVEPFRRKLRRVGVYADRVIYNSNDTRRQAEVFFQEWGRLPESIVSYLGMNEPRPDPKDLPFGMPPTRPYFVTVGTIEPRKNHTFLLDIWDEMGRDAPPLLICGARGWNNDAVFARLDALSPDGPVKELAGLSDAALAELVNKSAGTLFPSVAEGFGLPPVEALMLQARVLCNDLEVLHEILGDKPVYASVSDRYLWISTIKSWVDSPQILPTEPKFSAPNWEDHFKTVLRLR